MQEFLEIGQIVNTFGIKGMVKIKPFTDDINRFDDLEKYILKKIILKRIWNRRSKIPQRYGTYEIKRS